MTTSPAARRFRTEPRPACPVCGTPGPVAFAGLRDRLYDAPGAWDLRRCDGAACGAFWLDPCPTAESLPLAYEHYYTHAGAAAADPVGRVDDWITRKILSATTSYALPSSRAGRVAGRLLAKIGPLEESALASILWLAPSERGALLDVGCGAGNFLQKMSGLGWSVQGVEPDPAAAHTARARGLSVATGTLEDAAFPDGRFDVVTLNHVIEHLRDPLATLRECARVLAPGGRVLVVTPNAASDGARTFGGSWMAWDPPRHLVVFTPGSLDRLMRAAGFPAIEVRTVARSARINWRVSRQIQRRGRAPGMHCGFQPWYWPPSYAFHVREYLRSRTRAVGEEIIAVGRGATHPAKAVPA
jgi:2-polyprenyl-3-methyl-5-hydroxy-6-metoxy-1,4-benzoquinol methylase